MVAERTEPRLFVFARNGRWAWIYEEDSLRLASNDDFDSPEAALDSAAIAYPDVVDVSVAGADALEEPDGAESRNWMQVGVVLLLACAVLYFLWRRRS